jgi:hypothetical protein
MYAKTIGVIAVPFVVVVTTMMCVHPVFAGHHGHPCLGCPTPPPRTSQLPRFNLSDFEITTGQPLSGVNNYTLHLFHLPAFEDMSAIPKNGTCVDTSGYIYCRALGSMNLKNNTDGSVDIYVQNQSPGKGKESNWLQSPKGPFYIKVELPWWEYTLKRAEHG